MLSPDKKKIKMVSIPGTEGCFLFHAWSERIPFVCQQVNLSTRPEKFVGSQAIWDQAEQALKAALQRKVGQLYGS